jgi:hypothetical protein
MKPRLRQCPLCDTRTRARWCCGIDLAVRRRRWRMTGERVRLVHVIARSRKGLDEENYRLRLAAVGVASSKLLSRAQFHQFLNGLRTLPDTPAWRARQRSRVGLTYRGTGAMA